MPAESQGAPGTQADPAQQPQAGTDPTQEAGTEGGSSQPDSISLDEARKMRAEASGLRRRLRELEEQAQAQANATLSESERLVKRNADLERSQADWQRERQDMILERAVERHAAKLGFADPTDALGLLDRASLEFEADGTPRNVEQHLQSLAKSKPYLLHQATRSNGSFDTGTAGRSAPPTYTFEQLRDPKFYQDNKDDILRARQVGRIRAS